MKKAIVLSLIFITAALLLSCSPRETIEVETLDVILPSYIEYGAALGETPDIEGAVIDGKPTDDFWKAVKPFKLSTNGTEIEVYGKTSDKGIYLYITERRENGIFYGGRNLYGKASGFDLHISAIESDNWTLNRAHIRPYSGGIMPGSSCFKGATRVEGKLNSGESAALNFECFITWRELGLDKPMDFFGVYCVCQSPQSISDARQVNTYLKDVHDANNKASYIRFNADGYAE